MVLLSILGLPIRIVRIPFSLAILLVGFKHRRSFNLPVAGLDENKAQTIYYALTQAAADSPSHTETSQNWLKCLYITQIASSRVFSEIDAVEAHLRFWVHRLRSGNHFWFTLLRQGPLHFVRRLMRLFHIPTRHRAITADRGIADSASRASNDAEMVERRILILRLVLSELCETASSIQKAGSILCLKHQKQPELEQTSLYGTASSSVVNSNETFFSYADSAIKESLLLLVQSFTALHTNLYSTLHQEIYDTVDAATEPALNAPLSSPRSHEERPMAFQALRRALGIDPLYNSAAGQQRDDILRVPQEQIEDNGPSAAVSQLDSHTLGTGGPSSMLSSLDRRSPVCNLLKAAEDTLGIAESAAAFIQDPNTASSVHVTLVQARKHALSLADHPSHRLAPLPSWVSMPSQVQQHWLQYTLITIAITSTSIFLVKHSRLVGSRDLENWIQATVNALRGAWTEHVMDPLGRVQGELFNTFRRRPSIVSMAEYEADRDSLQRMLNDFSADYVKRRGAKAATKALIAGRSGGGDGVGDHHDITHNTAAAAAAASPQNGTPSPSSPPLTPPSDVALFQGMSLMMHSYENELKQPIKNLVSGDLMRSLLIQVQKLKVDTESAMLEIDQILKANELSISLVAAIPAFAIAGLGIYGLGHILTPAPPDPRREAVNARIAMIDVERAFEALAVLEEQQERQEVPGPTNNDRAYMEAHGMALYRVAVAYAEADLLFKKHRGLLTLSGAAEWPNLQSDVLQLAAPGCAAQKLRTAQRMMRVYAIYQHD